ncbi:MAG TPA: sulfatase-like hydrolase/transferase [Planctomycetota bacterium]
MAPDPRTRPLWAGLLAGLLLALADWIASGVLRTPTALVLASFLAAALAGAVAGGLARALGRARLGGALVLVLGMGLEGLSVASKELPPGQLVAGALATGVATSLAFALALRCAGGLGGTLAAIAAVPLGAGLAARLAAGPWVHLAGGWTLVFLGLWAGGQATRRLRALPWTALALAALLLQRDSTGPLERPGPAVPAAQGPSLVLLVIDTLRADEVAPEGALARFGQEGVVFRQCVSAAPWTLPSIASLLTGLHPSEHGAVSAASRLSGDVRTLAELLAAQGYATGAFTGGAFVGTAHGLERGFAHFDAGCERTLNVYGGHAPLLWRLARNRYFPQRWLIDAVDAYRGLAGVLAAASAWAEAQAGRPQLLFLHTYQVHDYYLYEPDFDDPVLAATPAPSEPFAGRLWVHPSELVQASAADLAHFQALYRGRIAALERLFPRLVAELTPRVGADAIWIVTADHGEGFDAERRRVHHGGRLHEDLLRVPLILRAPGRLAPGRVVEETVRSIDVLPTALELLGLPVPAGLAGQSLLPALRGAASFPATAFAEERTLEGHHLAVRREAWKRIDGPRGSELYSLAEDPHELEPRTDGPAHELEALLEEFRVRHPLPSHLDAQIDSTTREHLRALGYAD